MARAKKPDDPFRWFDSSPEVIRLVVMMGWTPPDGIDVPK